METIDSKLINDWLRINGPKSSLTAQSMFRLVWSEDAKELRKGIYRTYIGDIFIREEEKIEEVPKYNWLKNLWIVEQWYPPELVMSSELPLSNLGSYEPIYVFADKDNNSLPLNLAVVQFLVYHITGRKKSSSQLIKSTIMDEMTTKENKLDKYTEEALDVSTVTQTQLRMGEAIIVPSNYEGDSPNLKKKD